MALLMLAKGVAIKDIGVITGVAMKSIAIRACVLDEFGIKYTTEAIRKLLHKQGLRLIRPKVIPGNPPGEEEQGKNCQVL